MLLASHIIVSGLLGAQTENYFLAAALGLISHYALDTIPHWDNYLSPEFDSKVKSEKVNFLKDKFLHKELGKVAIDISIGLGVLSLMLLKISGFDNIAYVAVSIFFGVIPDPLQLLYFMTNWRLLKPNHDIQLRLHTLIYKRKPTFWAGISTQIAVIILTLLILYLL